MLRLTVVQLDLTAHLSCGICLAASQTRRLYQDDHRLASLRLMRHPLETIRGTGLLTRFPSATPFGLALGAD